MTRSRIFNITSALSLALLLTAGSAWAYAYCAHVPEEDRLRQANDAIHEAINRETWGTPAYQDALNRQRAFAAAQADYLAHREQRLADEHRRFVVLPGATVVALALTPAIWFVIAWRRWEHLPDRASRWLRLYRRTRTTVFAAIAFVSLLCAIFIVWAYARGYHALDSFVYERLSNDSGVVWSQCFLLASRGNVRVGFSKLVSPSVDYYRSLVALRQSQQKAANINVMPLGYSHSALGARSILLPQNYPVHRLLGAAWGSSRWGQGGSLPMQSYRYDLLIPLWMMEVVLLSPPAAWLLYRWHRRHEPGVGCCEACGYNLTGNASGVCPECGNVIMGNPE